MLENELAGTLVVSLEQAVAAPYCGLLLADAGARVIKVERPGGDFARAYDRGAGGQSAIFAWLNRGKESVCLDLKEGGDMACLQAMLAKADVLSSNLAPGAVERLGLTGDELRKTNPGLITCSISGYGESGAAARKKAYDFLVQAEVGLCSVTGVEDAPSRVGLSITDLSTGLTAYSAILRALLQRARTGAGVDLHITMFDVMADWMNMPLLQHRYMGGAPKRTGLKHSFIAPYGAFSCRDGTQLLISIQNNREWAILCSDILGNPDLAADPRFRDTADRYENRILVDEAVQNVFATQKADDLIARLEDAGIASARLNDVADLSGHSFLREAAAQIGEKRIDMAALPVQTAKGTAPNVPVFDENGPAIRREFSR